MEEAISDELIIEKAITDPKSPKFFKGYALSWPAIHKWSLEWFEQNYGEKQIAVNSGFYLKSPTYSNLAFSHDKTYKLLKMYLKDITNGTEKPGYVAAHGFSDGFEELENDINLPSRAPKQDLESQHFWISARGTITQLHFDRANNIFVQIFGRKKILLYPPSRKLKPVRIIGNWAVDVSELEIDGPTLNLPEPDYSFELGPGDVLYMPYGWWHKVISMEHCVSVNHWWWSKKNLATRIPDLLWSRAKVGLCMFKSKLLISQ